jgi:DNA-binding MarR family transcriptional regulator
LVKKLDKLTYPPLEDHIGVQLWMLSEAWKAQFDAEMVALGYGYFAEARSNVLRFVGPRGTPQSKIVKLMGLSKQAVQQLIDELVAEGVVEREADPADKRGKLVVLTQAGLAALHDANRVKRQIMTEYGKLLGVRKLNELTSLLGELEQHLAARAARLKD